VESLYSSFPPSVLHRQEYRFQHGLVGPGKEETP